MSDERNSYYQRATTWALDEQASASAALRWTRIAAGAAALIAILEALALMLLMPLKTVTMVPVLVDRQTGFVQTLKPDGRQQLQTDQALTQSLLAQYVMARENFDITTIASEHHKVALWSDGAARRDYLALMPASNPASPLRRYPRTTLIETSIKSVSPLGPHSALVRFETRRRDQDAPPAPPHAWAAVIDYRFSNEALTVADRWLNPLGFQVVSYRRDAEAPPPVEPATTPAASAPAPAAAAPSAKPPGPAMSATTAAPFVPGGGPT